MECLDDTVAQCRLDNYKAGQGCMSIITVTHIRAALQAILNVCHASLHVVLSPTGKVDLNDGPFIQCQKASAVSNPQAAEW